MANVSSSNGLEKYPKLRFPGFEEPYKQCRIGDIYAERGQRGTSDMELLSVTMNDGIIPRSEIEGKDNSSEDKSNYKIVHKGDMVYNSMRMWQGANGVSLYEGIVSPAYTVLMPKQPISNGYFAALFKSPNIINEFRKNSQGLTSDTWNLKYPQIKAIKVLIPSLSEQEKIADMIAILEKRIAKQAQLVDIFKKYKRGTFDAVFSQKIRLVPKPQQREWKPYKLSDFASR
uniref:restriction endonuclease subunit S n=1 Tax=Blautia sp. TaxID=1955243 RepID=UPI002588B234